MCVTEKGKKYISLMEELKSKILSGEIRPGAKLPSENELAQEYEISRHTVRKALAILVTDGYITTKHGKGTFCSDRMAHRKNSKNIAVVTTYISDYIFPRLIQGMDRVLTEQGYSIMLKNTGNSRQKEAQCLEDILTKDVDGLIIEPSKSQILCRNMPLYEQLDRMGIPYVFIQGSYLQMKNKPTILLDDAKGAYLLTKYLIDTGHRQIAGVFKADDSQGAERHKGYVKALQEAGMSYQPELVVWFHTEDRKVKPAVMVQMMLEAELPIDAVVCYNDQIAYGVIDLLQKHNVRVPEDVLVIGFDDSSISEYSPVKITSFVHPKVEMGRAAANKLIHMLRSSDPEQPLVLDMPLHEKESTRR